MAIYHAPNSLLVHLNQGSIFWLFLFLFNFCKPFTICSQFHKNILSDIANLQLASLLFSCLMTDKHSAISPALLPTIKDTTNPIHKLSLTEKWKLLVQAIIRPPKKTYHSEDLGSPNFKYGDHFYRREDHEIQYNFKSLNLSIFSTEKSQKFVILYLHSNASNKLEAIQLLKFIPQSFCLACFDFLGCGNNTEKTISLGVRQSEQTKKVVQYLRKKQYKIVLWGRSMGASTALLCGDADIIVADSSFSSFQNLSKQLAKRYCPSFLSTVLNCCFCCFFSKLKQDVMKEANYDLDQLDIEKAVQKIDFFTPIIFLAADQDQLIGKQNSLKLYKHFKGQNKFIQLFQGTHNSGRPKQTLVKVMAIIEDIMTKIDSKQRKQGKIGIFQFQSGMSKK